MNRVAPNGGIFAQWCKKETNTCTFEGQSLENTAGSSPTIENVWISKPCGDAEGHRVSQHNQHRATLNRRHPA